MARVLLVDDESEALKIVLPSVGKKKGHEVIIANNGRQGLEALSQNPDIIFCDFEMPEMDGHRFTEEIRTNPEYEKHSKIPIIGIGSFPEDMREHLTEFLQKPILYTKILEIVDKYCRKID